MNNKIWTHHNPVRVHFGRGCRASLVGMLSELQILIVCSGRGRKQLEIDPLLAHVLADARRLVWLDSVTSNPDIKQLQEQANSLVDSKFDCVVAYGGGSVIDTAKVLSLALSPMVSAHSIADLIGLTADIPAGASIPLYALPTTSGTGSEVTPYATIWDRHARQKLSVCGPAVYPHTAFVDPELSDAVPNDVTLSTGLDAINQAAESIWNHNITLMSELYATRALKLGFQALPRLLKDPNDDCARDAMAECSLLAGLAISQTRTAICHSISYPITSHLDVPHGIACAFTMSAVLRHNLDYDDGRFKRLATALCGGHPSHGALIERFEDFCRTVGVNETVRLQVHSLDNLTMLIDEMLTPGRADNNLGEVSKEIIKRTLIESWDVSN